MRAVGCGLEIYVSQYRHSDTDWLQIPCWGNQQNVGFFAAVQRPVPYQNWQAYPEADFTNNSPAVSDNTGAGLHPIKEHEAKLWLNLTDIQDDDFFLIRYNWGVSTSVSHVDLSWNNQGPLVVEAPFVVFRPKRIGLPLLHRCHRL